MCNTRACILYVRTPNIHLIRLRLFWRTRVCVLVGYTTYSVVVVVVVSVVATLRPTSGGGGSGRRGDGRARYLTRVCTTVVKLGRGSGGGPSRMISLRTLGI